MNDFVKFLQEYKVELITALAFILETVFIFIKRKPQSIDDFELALAKTLNYVPDAVSDFERPGNGAAKKNDVISVCLRMIECLLHRSLSDTERSLVIDKVSQKIEVVLTTPVKKEIQNEK